MNCRQTADELLEYIQKNVRYDSITERRSVTISGERLARLIKLLVINSGDPRWEKEEL